MVRVSIPPTLRKLCGGEDAVSVRAGTVADAIGQLPALKNSLHSRRPIISVPGPPSSSGITNSPTAGIITSMQPAMMPALDSGSVMLRKAFHGLAPRS